MQTDDMVSARVSDISVEDAQLAAALAGLASVDFAGILTLTRTTLSLAAREACCIVLGSYARKHEADESVPDELMCDAVDALVHALCAQPTSKRVLVQGLSACILWVSQKSHHSRVLAGKAGAVGAAVVAMCTDATDARLQELGCRLLKRLFFKTPENVLLAKDAQAIAAVLSSMRMHPNSKPVQLFAYATLAHATERTNVITSQGVMTSVTSHGAMTNCSTAVALGAVELVAFKLLDADEALSAAACDVLANLAFSLEGRLRAQQCGALRNVLEMMCLRATNDYAQSVGCMTLGTIIGIDSVIAVEADLGACARARIVSGMRQFPDDVAIQNNACCALFRLLLASPVPGYNAVNADDALACVIHAIQAHIADPTLQVHACMALKRLVESQSGNNAEVWRLGALPALVQVLETHVVSPGVVESCLRALSSLVSPPVALECGDAVAANITALSRAMVAAMSAHSHVPSIQLVGRKALNNMALCNTQRSLGDERGGERGGGCSAREVDLQAREEAERRADAMAAALIAEEEAERAAKSPARSNKSGKKKRAGSGAGVASTAAAAPSINVETAAAEAASAAASLAALTLDEHADDKSAPSAAALRRRRRSAAKAARKQPAGASGGQDDEAKGADTAAAVASLLSNDLQSADDVNTAVTPSAAASLAAEQVPDADTTPASQPPLPTAAAAFTRRHRR